MSRMLLILGVAFAFALSGCSDRTKHMDGYSQGKGDVGDFILQSAPKLGLRLLESNGLPSVPGIWHHRAADDALEVMIDGNCYPQLDAFLSKAVGPRQGAWKSSSLQAAGNLEAYYGTNNGATVNCKWGIIESGKEFTSLTILGYGSLGLDQTKYAQLLRQTADAVSKGNDSNRALDAARSYAPYVSEFVRLFPSAEVRHRNFNASLGFDVTADLYGRYELTMQLPAVFNSSRSNVIGYGEPRFLLLEAANVKRNKSGIAETTLNPAGERRFGSAEWMKIVEAGGDFEAIGYAMLTNQPVPGFSHRKIAKRP